MTSLKSRSGTVKGGRDGSLEGSGGLDSHLIRTGQAWPRPPIEPRPQICALQAAHDTLSRHCSRAR